jgi:hypothetical protein
MNRPPTRPNSDVRPHHRSPWWQDALKGAFLGDFARDLGFFGVTMQIILSFTPAVADICAARDIVAAWRHKNRVDLLLNILVMIPVVGGIAKVIEVWRHTRRIGRALRDMRSPAPPSQPTGA